MILLLRHGETAWNREGRIQGHAESALTPLGERQALAMADLVRDLVRLDASDAWRLVSSPIGRARQTAGAVSDATGLPVEIDLRLAEIGCGEWEGRLHEEIERLHREHYRQHWVYGAPGGESADDVERRARDWLADLPPEPARRIIAVSHGVWGRHLRGLYAGLQRGEVIRLDVPQDAVFRLSGGGIDRFDCPPED